MHIDDYYTSFDDYKWSSGTRLASFDDLLYKDLTSNLRTNLMRNALRTMSSVRNELQSAQKSITDNTDDWGYSHVITRTRTDNHRNSSKQTMSGSSCSEESRPKSSIKRFKSNNTKNKKKI